jgi:hypothetical protein
VAPLPGVGLGAVDIQETPNAYIFKVDVPGLNKDDVKGAPPSLAFRIQCAGFHGLLGHRCLAWHAYGCCSCAGNALQADRLAPAVIELFEFQHATAERVHTTVRKGSPTRAAPRAVRVTRDGVLVIEGERKQEEEKEENGFKRYERVFGQFVRRFRLVRAAHRLSRLRRSLGACVPLCRASLPDPVGCSSVQTSLACMLEANARLKEARRLLQHTCGLTPMLRSRNCHAWLT